jgi:hypothetical protein
VKSDRTRVVLELTLDEARAVAVLARDVPSRAWLRLARSAGRKARAALEDPRRILAARRARAPRSLFDERPAADKDLP